MPRYKIDSNVFLTIQMKNGKQPTEEIILDYLLKAEQDINQYINTIDERAMVNIRVHFKNAQKM